MTKMQANRELEKFDMLMIKICMFLIALLLVFFLGIPFLLSIDSYFNDAFCRPQIQKIYECNKYTINNMTLNMEVGVEIHWAYLQNENSWRWYANQLTAFPQEKYFIRRKNSTGEVINEFTFRKGIQSTTDFSLLNDCEKYPMIVELKSSKEAECKHTYLFACSEVSNQIKEMRSRFKESVAKIEKNTITPIPFWELTTALFIAFLLVSIVKDVIVTLVSTIHLCAQKAVRRSLNYLLQSC